MLKKTAQKKLQICLKLFILILQRLNDQDVRKAFKFFAKANTAKIGLFLFLILQSETF
jgi:hypothetical protein